MIIKGRGTLGGATLPASCSPTRRAIDGRVGVRQALQELQLCEAAYRHAHDVHGADDLRCGRAWDQMRRAGDAARAVLAATTEPADGFVEAALLDAAIARAEAAEGQLQLIRMMLDQIRPEGR
jgi:hypothetical protein